MLHFYFTWQLWHLYVIKVAIVLKFEYKLQNANCYIVHNANCHMTVLTHWKPGHTEFKVTGMQLFLYDHITTHSCHNTVIDHQNLVRCWLTLRVFFVQHFQSFKSLFSPPTALEQARWLVLEIIYMMFLTPFILMIMKNPSYIVKVLTVYKLIN